MHAQWVCAIRSNELAAKLVMVGNQHICNLLTRKTQQRPRLGGLHTLHVLQYFSQSRVPSMRRTHWPRQSF